MANNVQISASITISDGLGSKVLSRPISRTPTGTKFFVERQSVGTAVSTLSIGACATLRDLGLVNPSDSGGTITVTMEPIVLKPGDVAIFPPGGTTISLQATGASIDLATAGSEA